MHTITTQLQTALATGDTATLVDLNDWAVNEVRDYARSRDYDASAFYSGEVARITGERMSLNTYTHCRRVGSKFRCQRSVRRAVWVAMKTRRALADVWGV